MIPIKKQKNGFYSFGKYKNLTYSEATEKDRKYKIVSKQVRPNETVRTY